jgi:hypothetical protein
MISRNSINRSAQISGAGSVLDYIKRFSNVVFDSEIRQNRASAASAYIQKTQYLLTMAIY